MKKIRVYLKRPWSFGDSPYYEYLTRGVSDKIVYVNTKKKGQDIVGNIGKFKVLNKVKRVIKIIVRNFFPWLPNANIVFGQKNYDLVHCAHCLILNKKPWVVDIEYVNQFWAGGIPKKQKIFIKKILKNKNCKNILAWTEWSKKSMVQKFPEIEKKIEVVYPAIKYQNFKRVKSKKTRLLFVSRRFYFKGGLHAVEVMDRITKKYDNVESFVISDTPKEVIDKYFTNKKIKFMGFTKKEKLFSEIYPKTDILVYPSYTDTFGFIILEALSFGIPVITVGGHARSELVTDGKTGFVVEEPRIFDYMKIQNQEETISKIQQETEVLIKNVKLRKKMSDNSAKEFKTGRFSIEKRNKRLEEIYSLAIKK